MDAAISDTPLLPIGSCIAGKYVIQEVLGAGGSAVVYAAEQLGLRRSVALKVYPIREGTLPEFVERFRSEAQLLARVCDRRVVTAYDAGSLDDGSPFLVVERIHGKTLASHATGAMPIDEVVDLSLQVLLALCALEKAGITHRDVKPDNLMFQRHDDGSVILKLVDFGVAQYVDPQGQDSVLGVPGELVGTPLYMSPEQLRGEVVDVRSDLYSLGVTMFELLTGSTPYAGTSLQEIALSTLYEPLPGIRNLRADCPEILERIVLKALSRERDLRYETASEMYKELSRWEAERRALPLTDLWQEDGPQTFLGLDELPTPRTGTSRVRRRKQATPMRSFAMAALACLGALAGWHWEIFQNWDLSAMSRLIKTPEPPTQQVEVRAGAALAEDVGTRQPPSSQNSSMPPLAPHVPSESPEPEAVVDPASEVEPQAHNDPPVPRV